MNRLSVPYHTVLTLLSASYTMQALEYDDGPLVWVCSSLHVLFTPSIPESVERDSDSDT